MAITVNTPQCEKYGYILNAVSADASACEELLAAVAGKSIIIDHLTINSTAAISITVGQGETAGAVTTALIGPVSFAANQSMQWDFSRNGSYRNGMVLDVNTALTVDCSAGGAICCFVIGRIE